MTKNLRTESSLYSNFQLQENLVGKSFQYVCNILPVFLNHSSPRHSILDIIKIN